MSKLITVSGATGTQGGSVTKSILADPELSKEFKIRAITRDVMKPTAKKLAEQGVELINADLNSKESVSAALKGSHTVYLVTNFWETANPADEIRQGKNVADAAKEAGVQHLIFSSLLNVTKTTNGRLTHVSHFDGKAEIEDYIKQSGVPCTFVLAGYYMSNCLGVLSEDDDGVYTLTYPVSAYAKFPLFDAGEDMGKFVAAAIKAHDSSTLPNGAHVLAASAYYTPPEILETFADVTGHATRFVQVSPEQYKSFLPAQMADEILENHLFIEDPGYFDGADLEASLKLLEDVGRKPTTWREFLERNKGTWQ
ncbi:hypothetical protein W97_08646 [Coniosporium apollinis CBS 100218]|uniref:NmrA-like family domain-containing protein 1 n=1 Tax=Coniosporium apollinis (strain CBS 100218) TaxID=1168221 RepID=R7Z621_CONA1|nr:uncharacterized protein W97_08646 [Coniosporium apollinis CBS 100218]EON69386.1 hypothetical protein W97_08646 [Coniosporium apollinis CBS 100218]